MISDEMDTFLPDFRFFEHLEGQANCFGSDCDNISTQYLVKACGHSFWSCDTHLTSFWQHASRRPNLNTCNSCVNMWGAISGGATNAYKVVDW